MANDASIEEIHERALVNTVYVRPPDTMRRLPDMLCPRDELAHPFKLLACTQRRTEWEDIYLNGAPFSTTFVPLRRHLHTLEDAHTRVHLRGVYVVTDRRDMFASVPGSQSTTQEMYEWLVQHGAHLFLITSPLAQRTTHAAHGHGHGLPHVDYFANNNRPRPQSVPLLRTEASTVVTDLPQLIGAECFTLGNGLTLFLALHRVGILRSTRDVLAALRMYFEATDDHPAPTPDAWVGFYQMHVPTPMIAEYPHHYAAHGDPAAHADVVCFLLQKYASHAVFYPESAAEVHFVYCHPLAVMLPWLRPGLFERAEAATPWLQLEPDLHEWVHDMLAPRVRYVPDLTSLLMGVLGHRKTWRWWCAQATTRWQKILRGSGTRMPLLGHVLPVLFHLYEHGSDDMYIPYRRVRALWNQFLDAVDPQRTALPTWLRCYYVKRLLPGRLVHASLQMDPFRYWHPDVPYVFLKDVLGRYQERLGLYDELRVTLYTRHEVTRAILAEVFPDVAPDPEAEREGTVFLMRSLYRLMKTDQPLSPTGRFLEHEVDRVAAQRLLVLKKLEEQPHGRNIVAFLVREHMRDHRMDLIL